LGQRQLRERIPHLLRPGGIDRLGRHRERKAHHDHAAEPFTRDVDAFPEARGAQEQRALRLLERLEEMTSLAVDPLSEDEHLVKVHAVLESGVHVAQLAVRCEEHEGTTPDATRHGGDDILDSVIEVLVLGSRQVGRQANKRLMEKVERRGKDQLLDLGTQTDAGPEIVERPPHGESRRGENRRTPLVVNPLAEQGADIDWGGAQHQVVGASEKREPVDAVGIRCQERFAEQLRSAMEPAADDLQLSDALIRLRASQPIARAAHRPTQHAVERSESGCRVFAGEKNAVPARVFTQRRRQAQRVVPPLAVVEPRSHP
jgi:hypothetical protein